MRCPRETHFPYTGKDNKAQVNPTNSQILLQAGANVLVVGGYIFKAEDKRQVVSDLLY